MAFYTVFIYYYYETCRDGKQTPFGGENEKDGIVEWMKKFVFILFEFPLFKL